MHVFRKQTCFCSKFKMPWPSLPRRILEDFGPKINPCVASVTAAWEWEKQFLRVWLSQVARASKQTPFARRRKTCAAFAVVAAGALSPGPGLLSVSATAEGTLLVESSWQRSESYVSCQHLPLRARRAFRASLRSSRTPHLRGQQALSPKSSTPSTLACFQGHEPRLSHHCHCHFSPGQTPWSPCLCSCLPGISLLPSPRVVIANILFRNFSNTHKGEETHEAHGPWVC